MKNSNGKPLMIKNGNRDEIILYSPLPDDIALSINATGRVAKKIKKLITHVNL